MERHTMEIKRRPVLQGFINDWNEGYEVLTGKNPQSREDLSTEFKDILTMQQEEGFRNYVGLSSFGEHELLLCLKKLGFREPVSHRTMMIFMTGHLWEAIIIQAMKDYGLHIHAEQATVNYNGYNGHIDCALEDGILEFKTMSDSSFKQFTKNPLSNYKYVSQLGVYSFCTFANWSGWICLNKQTMELAYVPFDLGLITSILHSINKKIECMSCVNEVSDIRYIYVPEPPDEIFKKERTGLLLVPRCLKNTPYKEAFYDIYTASNGYGKPQEYVSDYKTPEQTIEWLNNYPHKL